MERLCDGGGTRASGCADVITVPLHERSVAPSIQGKRIKTSVTTSNGKQNRWKHVGIGQRADGGQRESLKEGSRSHGYD